VGATTPIDSVVLTKCSPLLALVNYPVKNNSSNYNGYSLDVGVKELCH